MANFKVILERIDTVTKQAEIMVEADGAEQARQFIFADLVVDEGSYDDDLRAIDMDYGDVKVTITRTESRQNPGTFLGPWQVEASDGAFVVRTPRDFQGLTSIGKRRAPQDKYFSH